MRHPLFSLILSTIMALEAGWMVTSAGPSQLASKYLNEVKKQSTLLYQHLTQGETKTPAFCQSDVQKAKGMSAISHGNKFKQPRQIQMNQVMPIHFEMASEIKDDQIFYSTQFFDVLTPPPRLTV